MNSKGKICTLDCTLVFKFNLNVEGNRGLTLLTEQGYLLIVKTYDDLAWKV